VVVVVHCVVPLESTVLSCRDKKKERERAHKKVFTPRSLLQKGQKRREELLLCGMARECIKSERSLIHIGFLFGRKNFLAPISDTLISCATPRTKKTRQREGGARIKRTLCCNYYDCYSSPAVILALKLALFRRS
jgi:hypothetical protein